MKKIPLVLIGATLLALSPLALGGEVTTRFLSPLSGRAWFSSDASCFSSGWNRVTNNGTCGSGAKKWLFDAPFDGTRGQKVNFWFYASAAPYD
jgi:hypothetical protein